MTVDVTESIQSTIHPAFQLLRQHHVEALDIQVSEYKHKVTGAIHYHLATENDENVFLVIDEMTHILPPIKDNKNIIKLTLISSLGILLNDIYKG